jgi:hypothetical protein
MERWIAARGLSLGILALTLIGCGAPAPARQRAAVAQPTTKPASKQAAVVPTRPPAAAPTTAPKAGDLLYVRAGYGTPQQQVAVVDTATGTTQRELPAGVVAADWSTIYTAEPSATATTVRAIDMSTGRALRQASLPGHWALPVAGLDGTPAGLSPNGRWLALTGVPTPEQLKTFERDNRWNSAFVILDTTLKATAEPFTLAGNFWFDALSNDGAALYLIENLEGNGQSKYQVRHYDVSARSLDPQIVVGKGESPVMSGTRQAAVASPNGEWLFSLYLNSSHGPFIHALNLQNRFAICIDLPAQGKEDWEKQLFWSLTRTSDGGSIYAANGALGIVAEIDTSQLRMRRSVAIPPAAASNRPFGPLVDLLVPVAEAKRIPVGGVVLSPDGKTLWTLAAKGLIAVDTYDLSVQGRYLQDWVLDSISISPDGQRLYAVSAERGTIMRLNTADSMRTEVVQGTRRPWGVLRVETTP